MWKTFYIQTNQIWILYHRSDFKKILLPGTYTYFGSHWNLKSYDLNQPEAKIDNLELLLRNHGTELQEHLSIVRTAFNQTALSGDEFVKWLAKAEGNHRDLMKEAGFIAK